MKRTIIIISLVVLCCKTSFAQSTIRRQTSNHTRTQTTTKATRNNKSSSHNANSNYKPSANTSSTIRNKASYSDGSINVNGISYDMVRVNAGTFTMGATSDMKDPFDDEKPTHQVTLTNDYYIGKTEVTQALWKAVMGNNPSDFKGDDLPVECVSWNDCKQFISKLNSMTGQNFRLPTEAEWEFAARGGNNSKHYQYSGSNNLDEVAWFKDNSESMTHEVATKQPNELGIYDMSGNVAELCYDWYDNYKSSSQTNPICKKRGNLPMRVHRGGNFLKPQNALHSSYRSKADPNCSYNFLGFRLALSE